MRACLVWGATALITMGCGDEPGVLRAPDGGVLLRDGGRDGDVVVDRDRCDPDFAPATCKSDNDCDNGCFCDGLERCEAGACRPSANPDPCRDEVACTDEVCMEETDRCFVEPRHERCSDGAACNGTESCNPAVGCEAGAPLFCGDGDPCTRDTCDDAAGCQFTVIDADANGVPDCEE